MPNKPLTGININCLKCKKSFYVRNFRIGIAKYCSRQCKDSCASVKIETSCIICNEKFQHISSRCNKAKYCSRKCYHKGQRKNGTIKFNCLYCNKSFNGSPSHIGKRKYCSIACTKKPKLEVWNPHFQSIRKRLKNRGLISECERCNFSKYPEILGVHHKDRNTKNNNLSNLEILCPNCHSIEHMKHTPHRRK